jgi:hypothetical protein
MGVPRSELLTSSPDNSPDLAPSASKASMNALSAGLPGRQKSSVTALKRQEQREAAPFYSRAGLRARTSCNGDQTEASAEKRMQGSMTSTSVGAVKSTSVLGVFLMV